MSEKKIVVVGSSNTDMVIKSSRLPARGETVLGGKFIMSPGGKGANQAVAAVKLGGNVTFITKIGKDIFGEQAHAAFARAGIDTSYVYSDEFTQSGVALIMVDKRGENVISVASGANAELNPKEIDNAKSAFEQSSIVLIQLEIPMETVLHTIKLAHNVKKKVILNPAPALVFKAPNAVGAKKGHLLSETLSPTLQSFGDGAAKEGHKLRDLLDALYIITPNQSEAELLTGIEVNNETSARKAAALLQSQGAQSVIITMGAKGAFVLAENYQGLIPASEVNAIDTTAAGDTFNGALAVALCDGIDLPKAVEFANKAAAFSVTKMGAQGSAPYLTDLT